MPIHTLLQARAHDQCCTKIASEPKIDPLLREPPGPPIGLT